MQAVPARMSEPIDKQAYTVADSLLNHFMLPAPSPAILSLNQRSR